MTWRRRPPPAGGPCGDPGRRLDQRRQGALSRPCIWVTPAPCRGCLCPHRLCITFALSSLAFEPIEGSPTIDKGGSAMKIVVIGGTGLIGSKTVAILRQGGHEVVAASPNSGVNTITGEGVKEAVTGAQVVIDLANSPSFEDKAVLEFFQTAGRNLLAAETAAGVRHHVALSIVGIDRSDNGYFRAKVAQEKLIVASGIPYTIIR